jgi:hypothetical protein
MRPDLGNAEGPPPHPGKRHNIDKVFSADQHGQLAMVELGDHDRPVALQDFTQVAREGIQVTQVSMGDVAPLLLQALYRRDGSATGTAPAQYQQGGLRRARDLEIGKSATRATFSRRRAHIAA